MEEESSSWVRRAKYSHTLYQRSNSSRESCNSSTAQSVVDLRLKFKSLSLEPNPRSLNFDGLSVPQPKQSNQGLHSSKVDASRLEPSNSQVLQSYNSESKPKGSNLVSSSSSSSLPGSLMFGQSECNLGSNTKGMTNSSSTSAHFSVASNCDSGIKLKAKPARLNTSPTFSFYPDGGSKSSSKWSDALPTPSLRVPTPSSNARTNIDSHKSGMPTNRNERNNFEPKRRSLSPLPTTILSDVFKEAKAIGKRFSTPPPARKRSSRVEASRSPSELSPMKHLSDLRAGEKSKRKKEGSWSKYFDHRGGKVTSVEINEELTVDLSKLYLGLRFACGAQSKLYHGMYNDRPVAVKIIRQPEDDEDEEKRKLAARLAKQFCREVTFLSHLSHPNVIKLQGACKNPPVFCIITKFLSGGSLRAYLHKLEHKSLPLQELVAISLQIARGMEYIHSQGIIHRDLKPENILFDQDFCVKIADFGIACEEAHCDVLAEDPGTYRWMAPEMIKHKPYGRKADVYSFGLLLWEMVTGTIPYEDMTPIQAAFAVVNKNSRPVIPVDCPAPLRALVEQCWASHPEKRPEFWQIVKVLEHFESALARDGTLNQLHNLTSHDHKKRLFHWIQKLKPLHADGMGPLVPKLS